MGRRRKEEGCIGNRAGLEIQANAIEALNSTGIINGAVSIAISISANIESLRTPLPAQAPEAVCVRWNQLLDVGSLSFIVENHIFVTHE
jgi:hypothetical protein